MGPHLRLVMPYFHPTHFLVQPKNHPIRNVAQNGLMPSRPKLKEPKAERPKAERPKPAGTRKVDKPLRRDVRWLEKLLDKILIELEGEELFSLEERIRKLAISRRRGPRDERSHAAWALFQALGGLATGQ